MGGKSTRKNSAKANKENTRFEVREIERIGIVLVNKSNGLIRQLFGNFNRHISKNNLSQIINQPNTKLLGIFEKDNLVGTVLLHYYQSLSRKVVILDELIIEKQSRNLGAGTKLLKEVEKWARRFKADCIECTTRENNQTAIRFFKRLRFNDRKQKAFRLNLK